jgi:hypothetical protein
MILGRYSVGSSVDDRAGAEETARAGYGGVPAMGSGEGSAKNSDGKKEQILKDVDPRRLFSIFNASDGNAATVGFYEALRGMSSGQISEMLANVDAFPNHARRRETRERLIDYLTMIDPLKALELREALPGQGILGKAFQQLGRNGLSEAVRIAESLEDAGDRRSALVAAYVGASEIDPVGAFATLKTFPEATASHYHEVFDNWAETDPAAAALAALTVDSAANRRSALKIVGQEWAESDPEAALAWIKTAQLSSFERENMRASALKGFGKRDPAAALELLSTLDAATRAKHLPGTVQALAGKDPAAALKWIRDEPPGYAKNRAVEQAIGSLANQVPDETLALAREFPELAGNVLGSAFGNLARNDLPGALEKLKEWEGTDHYNDALQNVASAYTSQDPDSALKWAMELPDDQKSNILRSVIGNIANDDPLQAASHLDKFSSPENQSSYDSAVGSIASSWARRDPVAAAEWLQSMPESNGRTSGLQQVANRWAQADPVSASEWIATLPQGETRDSAATALINHIQNDDPEMAIAWSENLTNPDQRQQSLYQVYSEWLNRDRTAALESLANSGIPDDMKRNLLPELQLQEGQPER